MESTFFTHTIGPDWVPICIFCEFSRLYLNKTVNLRQLCPPVTGHMVPKNMPNYRLSKVKSKLGPDPLIGNLMAAISVANSGGHVMCLQVVHVRIDFLPASDVWPGGTRLCTIKIYLCVQPALWRMPCMISTALACSSGYCSWYSPL